MFPNLNHVIKAENQNENESERLGSLSLGCDVCIIT